MLVLMVSCFVDGWAWGKKHASWKDQTSVASTGLPLQVVFLSQLKADLATLPDQAAVGLL